MKPIMAKHYKAHGPYPMIFWGTASGTWSAPMQRNILGYAHNHFHYVMRIVPHPTNANIVYATDNDSVWAMSQPGQTVWDEKWTPTNPMRHLHGLAIARSNPQVLYVGTGFGNWGSLTEQNKVWRTTDAFATTPAEITNNFPAPPGPCTAADPSGCTSLISLAVDPTDANKVYVGTFGSENDPGKIMIGKGIGVVRSTNALATPPTAVTWETINRGLCPDTGPCPAPSCPPNNPPCPPPAGSQSLFVGTVVMDNASPPNVYIATLNGLYKRSVTDGPAIPWTNITSGIVNPRFEAIAVDPSDATQQTLYAGTSEQAGVEPRIFKSTNSGATWTSLTLPVMQPTRAWSDRFRVRDIQVRGGSIPTGQPKAYAAIEGSGIYVYNQP